MLRVENHLVAIFLPPLDQAALEIGLRFGQIVEIQVTGIDAANQKAVDEFVSLVQVDGSHHRLERIAVDVFLDNARPIGDHMPVQSDMHGQRVERLPRDDFRTQLGHETLITLGILDKQVVGGNGLDDGVPEVLETLVVDCTAVIQNQRS